MLLCEAKIILREREMEPGKLDFFGTGIFWLDYRNPGIQIVFLTRCADDSTIPPFDNKENHNKNKTQAGFVRQKITKKEGNEVQVALVDHLYQVKLMFFIFNQIIVCG